MRARLLEGVEGVGDIVIEGEKLGGVEVWQADHLQDKQKIALIIIDSWET